MKIRLDRGVLKAAVVSLLVLALLLAGMRLLCLWEEGKALTEGSDSDWAGSEEDEGAMLYYQGRWYVPRKHVETVLILGLDRSQTEGVSVTGDYAQSDFLLLLAIDQEAGRCQPILLNRDTMVDIQDFDPYGRLDGTQRAQLALAYAHAQAYTNNEKAACQAAVEAVSQLLYGVEIDHYVTLTMDGLMALNDLAGGVTVEIQDDFSMVDPTLVQGERVTLLGEQALRYVRTRWWVGDSSNLERMERQRQYLDGLQSQLVALADQDEEFILGALLKINDHMGSDCTVKQLAELAERIRTFQMADYIALEGEALMGERYVEFHVDEEALQKLVIEEFYELAE